VSDARVTPIPYLEKIVAQLERIADALEKLAEPPSVTITSLPDPCGDKEYIGDGVYVTCGLPSNHQGRHQVTMVNGPVRSWP
jgi:hypothetical protein